MHELFRVVKGFAGQADEVEVFLQTQMSEYLRFGNNELGQSQHSTSRDLSIRVSTDKKQGRATTGRLESESIKRAVESALNQARSSPVDPDYLPMLGPQQYPRVDRYHEKTSEAPAEVKAGYVGMAIDKARSNGLLASGVLGTKTTQLSMLNTSGLEADYLGSKGYFSLTMDADNGNQTGYALSTFADIAELKPDEVVETALERAKLNRNQADITPGKYDVVIDPYAWSETLFFLVTSATAGYTPDFGMRQYKEGRSYLSGRLGEHIAGENVSVEDDCYDPLQTGPPFDGEGHVKSNLKLVEKGVLRNLASSRISAKRYSDAKPTGHELPLPNPYGELPTNLVIRGHGKARKPDELVKELDRGLLITRLWYVREVEPKTKTVTGMTRDGTFWVENGEIKKPVKNIRFNQSLLELFSKTDEFTEPVRNTADFIESTLLQPGILARDFNFTSVSVF